MNRNIARRTVVILFMASLYLSLAAMAQAQGPACSLALTAGKEFRGLYTSVTLSNGTALGTVINAGAKRIFSQNGNQQ